MPDSSFADKVCELTSAATVIEMMPEEPEILNVPDFSLPDINWPQLSNSALYGLAGDIVRMIEPHSEADPVALLVNLLVAFGNTIGSRPHFRAEADRHALRLFACMVGKTAKGRKGTSWGHIKRIFEVAAPDWSNRILSGLSSGEGLIWHVRDPIEKLVDGELTIVDAGIEDKRLLAMESEFASVIKQIAREGNTLSAIIRQAWDDGVLRTLTKNNPAIATGAHISIIGHITQEELLRHLNSTETANGFANRFLWFCVRRSKALPEGGMLDEASLIPLIEQLKDAIAFAKNTGEIRRDERAREIWYRVYEDLSEGRPGMLGAVTSRAEAQVMRIACIYALLDLSNVIRADHLMAALELWDYANQSAEYIFGAQIGDPVADTIYAVLKNNPKGLTRTDLYNYFGRNKSRSTIASALSLLESKQLAVKEVERTDGRPKERWFSVTTH